MLMLKRDNRIQIASMPLAGQSLDRLLEKEWLLTNDRGGFACGTVLGCNTRRYHGLLVGSLKPPVDRIVGLSNCRDIVIKDGKEVPLSVFEFDGKFTKEPTAYLKRFYRDIGAHFEYSIDGLEMTKSIYLHPETDTVGKEYDFSKVRSAVEFVIRPLVALRNFHSLQNSYAHLYSVRMKDWLCVRHNIPHSYQLFFRSDDMCFEHDCQWWFNFVYRRDKERGQDFAEDLWTPGFFKCYIDEPRKVAFQASLTNSNVGEDLTMLEIDALRQELYRRQNQVLCRVQSSDHSLRVLYLAADQFIVKRQSEGKTPAATILAGFPWFADWGRDSFIALPGLLLTTERFDEAKSVLMCFAAAADEGMIPNRFDDYSGVVHYNSIDASLWFVNAAFEYLDASGDHAGFAEGLLPRIRWIVESYCNGTKFGIHADSDSLITGGDAETQLTWMDAKCDGTAFTPRYGKTVEVNALWYAALCRLAAFYRDKDEQKAQQYGFMAEEVAGGFVKLFWNESADCLYDCILPNGTADGTLRPNQIFTASLPFSPLSHQQQRQVVEKVQQYFLTDFGLRTLNSQDQRYRGQYIGPHRQRDEAYHQGTVWPHLMGPFVEAYLRVNNFSKQSKKEAFEFIEPLLEHLTDDGCIGSVSEIFDGNPPHQSRGCIAQAWAVAELIRAYKLTQS